MKPGDRVGAMLSAEPKGPILFLGYGVYDGDQVPPKDISPFGSSFPNPRITLDDGVVVWGCQCWWGDEEEIKANIAGREIVFVNIDGKEKVK
jgi:hypothetical protein